MTYNGKHHWVFPLVATACSYAKLNDYFRKIQKGQIEISQVQGDFGDHLEVRKVTKGESRKLQGQVENANRLFRKCKCDTRYVCANGECSFGGRNWENNGG